MPGFHHSVAVLPFRIAIPLPLQVRTEMLETSFRIHGDEVTRTLIGCPPTAERKKQDQILLLRNGGYGATAGGNGNGDEMVETRHQTLTTREVTQVKTKLRRRPTNQRTCGIAQIINHHCMSNGPELYCKTTSQGDHRHSLCGARGLQPPNILGPRVSSPNSVTQINT